MNNRGITLVQVMIASLFLSIVSLTILRGISEAHRETASTINRSNAFNVAESLYNHIFSTNRTTFIDDDNSDDWIGYYDYNNCAIASGTGSLQKIFDIDTCQDVLAPVIGERVFPAGDITFYVYKLNSATTLRMTTDSSLDLPSQLISFAQTTIDEDSHDRIDIHRISILVKYDDNRYYMYNGYLLK